MTTPSPTTSSPTASGPTTGSLHQRLVDLAGTEEVFSIVADRLYDRILGPVGGSPEAEGDARLAPFFRNADGSLIDRRRLHRHMTHFLAAALGGSRRYSGRGMAAAHAGRHITDEAFDRVVGHVVAVLQELAVPPEWISEVGGIVAPLRESIVTVSVAAPR